MFGGVKSSIQGARELVARCIPPRDDLLTFQSRDTGPIGQSIMLSSVPP